VPYSSRSPGGKVKFEMASRLGHLPTSNNPLIQERLARYHKPENAFDASMIEERVSCADDLPQTGSPAIRYVVCVDGSGHEDQEAFERYPSTRVLYLQIAGVFIDLQHLQHQPGHFVDPARIADAIEASVVSGFLPGSYLEHEIYKDPVQAFRAETFDLFASTQIQRRSLLDLLCEAQKYGESADASAAEAGELLLSKCPNGECRLNKPGRGFAGIRASAKAETPCPSCRTVLWPTDALRIWEAFQPDASNGECLGRTRDVIEHLVLLGVALSFEELSPKLLQQTAFICDGDLALFGQPARFHKGILGAWQALWERCQQKGLEPPLVLGIAKSGYPVEHFHGIQRFVPRRHLMRLDDKYMAERLRVKSLTETYFGRKLYYHARDGQLLVITVPPGRGAAYGGSRSEDPSSLDRFPTLSRTLDLLDSVGTRLYDDAVIPVSLAHHWAAYPLANAERVLRILTERTIGKPNGG
jgi:hypothetical protein